MGAKHKKVSAHASFMVHSSSANPQAGGAEKLKRVVQSLIVDDERTEAILRKHLTLSGEQWQELAYHDITYSAADAVTVGLADEVAEFLPPSGIQVANL